MIGRSYILFMSNHCDLFNTYTVLLHAAATFWDTRVHVFRFNGQELCPLIEEFAAILGYLLDSTAMIILPDLNMQILKS